MEDHGGGLAERVETRCGQLVGLLRERREVVCPLEADHDQVGSVVPCEVEGKSAADGCARSLGGIEAPRALEVARIPSVIVPVCVVSRCVYTSVLKCVLRRTHSVRARACAKETPCVRPPQSITVYIKAKA